MNKDKSYEFYLLKDHIIKQQDIIREIEILYNVLETNRNTKESNMIVSQINSLILSLRNLTQDVIETVKGISLEEKKPIKAIAQPLPPPPPKIKSPSPVRIPTKPLPSWSSSLKNKSKEKIHYEKLEKISLKRLLKGKKPKEKKKEKKPNHYVKLSNQLFSKFSVSLFNKNMLQSLEKELTRANIPFTPTSYASLILFTTAISFICSIFLLIFLVFFNVSPLYPFVSFYNGALFPRFLKIFWIIFVIPIITFLSMYVYPSFERKSLEDKIDHELSFAVIHMAAIGGSMIEPTRIFEILLSTKEYKYLEKEFIKIINEVNLYGYNLVTALRRTAYNTPSKRFAELLTGLATTITSGGDLTKFFNERAKSFLFEYRIDREKKNKASETFMDIYISAVIAAPMILMLLLMMMKVSGLGLNLTISTISLIMVLAVSGINIMFLMFLHLKQPKE